MIINRDGLILSVIIPVFNVEKYIEECVRSVLGQTYKNLDIILVDDGPMDNSASICKRLEKEDDRIRLIKIQNSGSFQARKVGALYAKGNIITFVDADDIIETDAYENLVRLYGQYMPDILLFNYEYNNESIPKNYYAEGLYLERDIQDKIILGMMYDYTLGCRKMEPSVINKLIKKDLFLKVTDEVDSRIPLGDDALITYPSVCLAKQIYVTNKVLYHYRKNTESCTHTFPLERIIEVQNFQKEISNLFEKMGVKDMMQFQVGCYVRSFISMMVKNWYGIVN